MDFQNCQNTKTRLILQKKNWGISNSLKKIQSLFSHNNKKELKTARLYTKKCAFS